MRLGLLAYATDTGLGYQTKSLYKYLKPDKVMLCDISKLNKLSINEDWYNFDIRTDGIPTNDEIDHFLKDLDIVFVCETPLNYYLFERANQLGIKTILQANPEFFDYFQRNLPKPSLIALPSRWLLNEFKGFDNLISLPVPIDNELPRRTITQAKIFFHIAGRPAVHDRNGTLDYIEAVKLIQDRIDADFLLYIQDITPDIKKALKEARIELRQAKDRADLYKEGDVLILPRKYGGLCLPAQEAIGCGIPVIMPNISPNNEWMPSDWLVNVSGKFTFKTRLPIDAYTADVNDLSHFMIMLYNHPTIVSMKAREARNMAWMMSWDNLLPKYKEMIECTSVSSAR